MKYKKSFLAIENYDSEEINLDKSNAFTFKGMN